MSSPLNTTIGSRNLLVLENLQQRLEKILPTAKDFGKYRYEILNEDPSVRTKSLINNEERLQRLHQELDQHMQNVKDNQKKKEFVDVRAKLHTTTNNLKEVSRKLNRVLCESISVTENGGKLQTTFGWMKQKLEKQEVEAYLLGENEPVLASVLTTEKIQNIMNLHTSLQTDISKLMERQRSITLKKAEVEAMYEQIQQNEKEIKHKTEQGSSSFIAKMSQARDSKLSEFQQMQNRVRDKMRKYLPYVGVIILAIIA